MNRRTFLAVWTSAAACMDARIAHAAGITPYEPDTFAKTLSEGAVIVHVFADWCPVCKAQKPLLAALASDPKLATIRFVAVNFDKDKEFLKMYKVANQSVIVIFKAGKEIARLAGTTDAAKIRDAVLQSL